MRAGGSSADGASAALQRDYRLLARYATRDLEEPAWIAEALDIEKDHARPLVVLPVFEEVVRRYVGLVADADEMPDAEAEILCVVEHGEAERARLGAEGNRPARWPGAGEVGVEANVIVRIQDAEAIGADEANTECARAIAQARLRRSPFRPELCKARGDDDGARDLLVSTVLENVHHVCARHRNHGEIDRTRDRAQRWIRRHRLHVGGA